MIEIKKDALAIYKGQAALILDTGKKLEIKLSSGELKKVRDKDITVIHQGPVKTLSFQEVDCDIEEVWTLLQEESTFSLIELSEFLYGDSSSNSVFNAYNILQKNLYFSGDTESINCNTREYIESEIEKEQLKEQKSQEFSESIIRLSKKEWSEKDQTALREIEELALEQRLGSKILKTLGIKETSIDAQRFLIEINYWKIWTNPYPGRMGVSLKSPDTDEEFQVTKNPLDLTYLNSYAIDDEGSRDPDDALSLDGDYKLWVHITDVASIVKPDSKSDNEASSKGANLYLPDQTVHMLPAKITELQALGHPDGNNALSFLFEFDKDYNIINREIHLSRVIVDRVSYEEVESQRDSDKFRQFYTIAEKLKERRLQNGAVSISLPEVKIRVNDLNEIDIKPISGVESRNVVSEFMLLAGESAAIFCFNKGIPIPYATQQASDSKGIPDTDLASMFNWRRKFKRGETKFKPESHFGLGLEMYTRATSPLRRYSDLVVNQQIRAYILNEEMKQEEDLLLKISPAIESMKKLSLCERASNLHWKLVYLSQNRGKIYTGTFVEKKDSNNGTFIIEELALEIQVSMPELPELNSKIPLKVKKIDIPTQLITFVHH